MKKKKIWKKKIQKKKFFQKKISSGFSSFWQLTLGMGVFIRFMGSPDCKDLKNAMEEVNFRGTWFTPLLGFFCLNQVPWKLTSSIAFLKSLQSGLPMNLKNTPMPRVSCQNDENPEKKKSKSVTLGPLLLHQPLNWYNKYELFLSISNFIIYKTAQAKKSIHEKKNTWNNLALLFPYYCLCTNLYQIVDWLM